MAKEKSYRFKEDDGKNTIIVIAVLLVLIVIVGGGLLMLLTQKAPENLNPPPSDANATVPQQNQTAPPDENETGGVECDGECQLAAAVSQKNVSACRVLPSQELAQSCLEQLSSESLDACKALTDASRMAACITAFAVSDKNISLCGLLGEGRSGCRAAVDPCADSDDVTLCRAIDARDPSKCGESQDCLFGYALETKDDSACSLIQNRPVAAACTSVATDNDKCLGLWLQPELDYCHELYAVHSDKLFICDKITTDTVYGLNCYSYFAGKQNNLSLCDLDGLSLDSKWACYTNFSLISGNLSGCISIHKLASTNRFKCAFEYGKKYGNPAACEVIDLLPSRSTCYEGVLIYSNENLNWTYCKDVTSYNWRNYCFTESAQLYDDLTICNGIEVLQDRQSCIDNYLAIKGS